MDTRGEDDGGICACGCILDEDGTCPACNDGPACPECGNTNTEYDQHNGYDYCCHDCNVCFYVEDDAESVWIAVYPEGDTAEQGRADAARDFR